MALDLGHYFDFAQYLVTENMDWFVHIVKLCVRIHHDKVSVENIKNKQL